MWDYPDWWKFTASCCPISLEPFCQIFGTNGCYWCWKEAELLCNKCNQIIVRLTSTIIHIVIRTFISRINEDVTRVLLLTSRLTEAVTRILLVKIGRITVIINTIFNNKKIIHAIIRIIIINNEENYYNLFMQWTDKSDDLVN